ncbi:MAG: hypothetical protein NTY70_07090, partial [Burkholderiales bacterium]|nr:hypothetical protein [Burkholderiales bacterium]
MSPASIELECLKKGERRKPNDSNMRLSNKLYIAFLLCTHAFSAIAAIDAALLKPLTGDDPDARI